MAEYIEREALKAEFEEDGHLSAYIEEMIDSIPAADVREVERGKWEDDGYGWVRCSICRGAIAVARGGNRFNYCPNCGADMRSLQNANNLKEMEEQNG